MITIKDIAKEANVSEGTVDRVLHNRGGVSKKTEAKIKVILEYHNFSVNPVASALAMKNKYCIAALIPEYNESDLFWKSPQQYRFCRTRLIYGWLYCRQTYAP